MNEKGFFVSVASSDWDRLIEGLFTADGYENAAVLLCGVSDTESELRLLVRSIVHVRGDQYDIREPLRLNVSPEFYNQIITECLETGLTPVIIHSHPFDGEAWYSSADDFGESRLLPVLQALLPDARPASLLVTRTSVTGRFHDGNEFRNLSGIRFVGEKLVVRRFDNVELASAVDVYDRQIRAFGDVGQRRIRDLKSAVIGTGGIGSIVAEQLARVGVEDLTLIDDDVVEDSNLSRLVGATRADLGKNKAEVIARHLSATCGTKTSGIADSALRQDVLLRLRDREVIFVCVDNDRTRSILNRFSHQYLIPIIDLGTRLDAREGAVTSAAGRVSIVGHDVTCLRCSHHISSERIRAESLSEWERAELVKEGYVMGIDDPAPAVISINTVVAGLGVTGALNMVVGLTGGPTFAGQIYDARTGSSFPITAVHEGGCDVCDTVDGVKGLGDQQIVSAY
jgi:hypothetical protein